MHHEDFVKPVAKKRKHVLETIQVEKDDNQVKIYPYNRIQKMFLRVKVSNIIQSLGKTTLETENGLLIHLIDLWKDSYVKVGDYINIISKSKIETEITISRDENLIVVHPDVLLNCSKMSESYECIRKGFFDRFLPYGPSIAALHGIILHHLFQSHFENKISNLQESLSEIMKDYVFPIYECDTNEQEIIGLFQKEYKEIFEKTQDFYMVQDLNFVNENPKMIIEKVADIEESIWSVQYGLKAKVDVTVQAKLNQNVKILPFELKTGKLNTKFDQHGKQQHQAQVLFYMLLMSERYEEEIQQGILYYVKPDATFGIKRDHKEITSLIFGRNQVAASIVHGFAGDTMKKREKTCTFCFSKSVCMMYHKAVEKGDIETSGAPNVFETETKHLDEKDCRFFATWFDILDTETPTDYFWHYSGPDREAKFGTCLSSLVMESEAKGMVTLKRSLEGQSLKNTMIQVGDMVHVGTESGHFGIAFGVVTSLDDSKIILSVDHPLKCPEKGTTLWRLDKRDGITEVLRSFVISLSNPSNVKFRDLIIKGVKPIFEQVEPVILPNLHPSQLSVLNKCLSVQDYLCVNGMAGSGKTFVIAYLIKELVARGKRVIYSSHTNFHLEIMNSLLESLGVQPYKLAKKHNFQTSQEVKEFVSKQMVMLSPLNTTRYTFLSKIEFDVCLVDEATQIFLPWTLGVILHAKSFILFGDPNLPGPKKKRSLWKLLTNQYPDLVETLTCQYRMIPTILEVDTNYLNSTLTDSQESSPSMNWNEFEFDSKWLNQVKNQDVSFVLTDSLMNPQEEAKFSEFYNPSEAIVVQQIVSMLIQCEVDPKSIGILTLYAAQLERLEETCHRVKVSMTLLDRCFGLEKDIIVVSLIHCSSMQQTIITPKMMHLIMSRAKSKIIFVGNGRYHANLIPKLMRIMKTKKYLIFISQKEILSSPQVKKNTTEVSPIIKDILESALFLE